MVTSKETIREILAAGHGTSRSNAARVLGVSDVTIDRLIKAGDLRATRIGRRVVISTASLAKIVAPLIEEDAA